MTMRLTMLALVASITTTAYAQGLVPYYRPDGQVYYRRAPDAGYAPPGVPPDIIAPERPPPMTPAPTAPIQREPNPLIEWCKQEANAKAPLCRNVGSPRVQR